MDDIKYSKCSNCGGKLTHGYLLGKHSRIRWSISRKGMTVFHGVPLNILKKGFWCSWKNWLYAPSLPAAKCEKCRTVLFTYDNNEIENPKKEIFASLAIGTVLVIAGISIVVAMLFAGNLQTDIPLFLRATAGFISIVMLLPGIVLLKHAIDSPS